MRIEESGCGGGANPTAVPDSDSNPDFHPPLALIPIITPDLLVHGAYQPLKKRSRGSAKGDSPSAGSLRVSLKIYLQQPPGAGRWEPPTSDPQPLHRGNTYLPQRVPYVQPLGWPPTRPKSAGNLGGSRDAVPTSDDNRDRGVWGCPSEPNFKNFFTPSPSPTPPAH